MLFAIKRRALPALVLALVVAALGLALRHALALGPLTAPPPLLWLRGAVCLAAVITSDALLQSTLALFACRAYLHRYVRLTRYFAAQTPAAILAGGVLAAAEELLLRGVLLELLRAPLGDVGAVAVAALVFGALHIIPDDRGLRVFALWATWEGALLGATYVLTGSLVVTMAVHAAHDIGGFVVFAVQRRTGWLLPD